MIFLLFPLIASILASIAGGIVGSYVIVKRISFLCGSIAHAVLSGMGLCLWLSRTQGLTWLSPIYGAIVAAIAAALLIGWVHLRYRQREDAVIAAIWAIGMAIGVIFISLTPGYNVELMSFLLGSILWVSPSDLITLGVLDLIIVILAWALHTRFSAVCFDETQAKLQGVRTRAIYLLLLTMIALTIVLLIQVVGIILVIAMLTIPPTIAGLFSRRVSGMIYGACVLSIAFSIIGLAISYAFNWPAGATIALAAGASYLIALPVKR